MASAEITGEQQFAIRTFGEACAAMMQAMYGLEQAGVSPGDALRLTPGPEQGQSLYDSLPPALRMMI